MAVENETILNKMMNELNKAKESQHDKDKFKQHIEHVKLLCELFIDEENTIVEKSVTKQEFSEAELKAMIGEPEVIKKIQQQQIKKIETLDHDDANGNSIFDF